MKFGLKNYSLFLSFLILQAVLIFLNDDGFLFWDTSQFGGKHALHYYQNGLTNGIFVPDWMDSGNPSFFGYYISIVWKLFGLSLPVAHWALFPFLVALWYNVFVISETLCSKRSFIIPSLLLVCPFFIGHSVLVSPDLILLSGFSMCIYASLKSNHWVFVLGSVLMCLMSLRGIALLVPLFLYEIRTDSNFSFRGIFKIAFHQIGKFLPAIILALSYLGFHWFAKGWISGHADSPWAPSFALVSGLAILKNIFSFGHKILDFGMLAVFLILCFNVRFAALLKGRLAWLYIFIGITLAILIIPRVGLLNHRYFLPLHFIGILISGQLLAAINNRWLTTLVLLFVVSGNFWFYPQNISQGWDSTLAHYGVYKQEKNLRSFILDENIASNRIATVFPFKNSYQYLHLTNLPANDFVNYYEDPYDYIFYSNIMNDWKDSELSKLNEMEVIYERHHLGIVFKLYRK